MATATTCWSCRATPSAGCTAAWPGLADGPARTTATSRSPPTSAASSRRSWFAASATRASTSSSPATQATPRSASSPVDLPPVRGPLHRRLRRRQHQPVERRDGLKGSGASSPRRGTGTEELQRRKGAMPGSPAGPSSRGCAGGRHSVSGALLSRDPFRRIGQTPDAGREKLQRRKEQPDEPLVGRPARRRRTYARIPFLWSFSFPLPRMPNGPPGPPAGDPRTPSAACASCAGSLLRAVRVWSSSSRRASVAASLHRRPAGGRRSQR